MAASTKLVEVVCLVFLKDGRLLLEQRIGKEGGLTGRWTFPGGKVEPEEPKEVAAFREAEEETNLRPKKVIGFISFREKSRKDGKPYLFHGMLIKTWSGRVQNREPHRRNLAWFTLKKSAEKIADTEVDKRILESFLRLFIV